MTRNDVDISMFSDYLGKIKTNYQATISDAKVKIQQIMLKMFSSFHNKSNEYNTFHNKSNEYNKKSNLIKFQDIYDHYLKEEGFITPALCFLTILHLANEHNLILHGTE